MAFLVLNGVTVPVIGDGAAEGAPLRFGARDRGATGRDGGRVRSERRTFRFTSFDLTESAWTALRGATPPGVPVPCSGDALPAPGQYVVARQAALVWNPQTAAGVYTATLTLDEG